MKDLSGPSLHSGRRITRRRRGRSSVRMIPTTGQRRPLPGRGKTEALGSEGNNRPMRSDSANIFYPDRGNAGQRASSFVEATRMSVSTHKTNSEIAKHPAYCTCWHNCRGWHHVNVLVSKIATSLKNFPGSKPFPDEMLQNPPKNMSL